MLNSAFWGLLLSAPLLAALASTVGYLTTAQALLARTETSVAIWFLLLVVYHIIRRWMLIQRRRIAFDRAKQRRADIGPARPRRRRNFAHPEQHRRIHRSGRFGIRSGHHQRPVAAAGAFDPDADRTGVGDRAVVGDPLRVRLLENISLWDVTSTVNGVETAHPITLGAVLIAILVLIITMQLVRNLPALLELAVLQHWI